MHDQPVETPSQVKHSAAHVEAVLAQAVQQSPAIVVVLRGPAHRYEMVNPAFEKIGPRELVAGRPAAEVFPELGTQGVLQLLDRARAGEAIVVDEMAIWLRDPMTGVSQERFFTFTLSPLAGDITVEPGVLITAFDLTEGIQARRRAETERARLHQVIAASPEAIALADASGRVILANGAATAIWGGQPLAVPIEDYSDGYGAYRLDGTPYPSRELPLARSILNGETVRDARLYVRNRTSGAMTPVLVNSAPLYDAEGRIDGGVVIFQDISAAHNLEQAREEARTLAATRAAELEAVLSGMDEAAIVYDGDWKVLLANSASRDLFLWEGQVEGLRVGDLVQRVRADLGDDQPKLARIAQQADDLAQTNEPLELQFVQPPRAVIRRSSTIRDATGAAIAHIVIFQDITRERAAAQEKDDFLRVTSHELKTPLTSLRGMAQVSQRRLRQHNIEGALHSLDVVLEQAQRLERLIDDLLDISRIQAGHLALEHVPLDLIELARAAVQRHQATAEERVFNFDAPQGTLLVEGDAGRLEQVFDNLLSNAVKYSPAGGAVTVQCSREPQRAIVRVQDPGIGIDRESRGLLFEQFYRAENARARNFAGMGVGLWISRQIIERHDGQLWLDETGPNGSIFAFALPLHPSSDAARGV